MEKYKSMLVEAIKNSDIIPPKQKGTLEVLCLSEYPLTASAIEKKLHSTTQRVHFSLKSLLKRNFIIRGTGVKNEGVWDIGIKIC